MRRLYFRIYLAVLGSLLVFALLAGLAAVMLRALDDDDRRPWFDMGAEIAERLLPADRDAAFLASQLKFWHERTGFSLILLSAGGEMIAQTGTFPGNFNAQLRLNRGDRPMLRDRRGLYALTLEDGRRLIARRPAELVNWLRHLRWLAALVAIGLAVGVSAYPVVRHLTRRLERLQQGVAAFGEGDMSARVDIPGGDEIAKLAGTFNAAADRIEHLLNAHKTLLANASHELRSPLSRLRMAVETLQGEGQPLPAHAEIKRNIAELDALVEEILLASRLQADAAYDIKRESVDLVGLLAEECAPYSADLIVIGATMATVSADARLLRRLFRNLLENAARYGGNQLITVSVGHDAAQAHIAVCDRGPGIPESERGKIFEPFYRVRTVPESAGGAGLGLALVRQIAERHDGGVQCLPRAGGGACFRVSLPLAVEAPMLKRR